MTIEIVDLPIENGGSFHSYVSLPEGILHEWLFKPTSCLKISGNEHTFLWLRNPAPVDG